MSDTGAEEGPDKLARFTGQFKPFHEPISNSLAHTRLPMVTMSIVIVSWNTREILRDCLASIYENAAPEEFQIIVVDNDSADGSAEMVKEQFPKVDLIVNDDNLCFAAANNVGFKIAKGDYILLLNSDTIVLGDALQKTLAYAQSKPDYGIVSCKILNEDHSLQPNCFMLPSFLNSVLFLTGMYKLFPNSKFFGRAEMTWWDYANEIDVEALKGCFMLVRKEALDQVGGMDEQFFMYSEEIDWCYRFSKQGWKLGFYPDASIIHLGGVSAAKLGADRALIKDKSSIRYMRKHYSTPHFYIGYLMMVLFYMSRLPAAAALAAVSKNEKFKKIRDNHLSGLTGLLLLKHVKG
jgi:GT2 family glycosyltransferase